MVAYSFSARFAPLIVRGDKRQTIRAHGKRRHARPGEALQLYQGMRTRHCTLLAVLTCVDVLQIRMRPVPLGWVVYDHGGPTVQGRIDLDHFARNDGFEDWVDLCEFWRIEHPAVDVFAGVRITWGAST